MRTMGLAGALAAALWLAACKGRERVPAAQTEEEQGELAGVVHMADERAASQLLSGFHTLEQNSWRWTAGRFAVLVRTQGGAAEKGANLRLKFFIPDAVLAKLKVMALSATVNGMPLAPESYTQPGDFTYAREVPPAALRAETAKVEFALDKFLPPSEADQRELGVVVTSVGLEPR